jgi:hypothetical protein
MNFNKKSIVALKNIFALLTATLCCSFIGNLNAQTAPSISYQNPITLSLNISPGIIQPTNNGGVVPGVQLGTVTTIAGTIPGGFEDGPVSTAQFYSPQGLCIDGAGNIYIADNLNSKIRKISADGQVTTFAGSYFGASGYMDGASMDARFSFPSDIISDNSGNLFVCDRWNQRIRKIDSNGIVTTYAGSYINSNGFADGPALSAQFYAPKGIIIDQFGNIYVADAYNNRIRKIDTAGNVSTIAGGEQGFQNGPSSQSRFYSPSCIAFDSQGNLIVSDESNHAIRKISPDGNVSTIAGGVQGYSDGFGSNAMFYSPASLIIDAFDNIYVSDQNNNRIRKISPQGYVSTLAGGEFGDQDGVGVLAQFRFPFDLIFDLNGDLVISDMSNHKIKKISLGGWRIYPELPDGLIFNSTNGEISGTPTALSPLTNYTVIAVNTFGSDTTTFSLGVFDCLVPGCTEANACNYNSNAVCNDGTCIYAGCTNPLACNFNSTAGCDDGSCHFVSTTCDDGNSSTILDAFLSDCTCAGIPFDYGFVENTTNTICPEILSSLISINTAPTAISNYSLQWYFKTGNNAAPTGSNTSGWNLIPGATSSSLTVGAFTGTRTYTCFVTPDASYGISGNWMSGAKVLTYSSFAAQTIIGNPNITPFNAYNYIVNPIPGHTYNWTVSNGAIASGQGTNNVSIMWGQNGPYQLTLTESDGTCTSSSYLFAVNNSCSISVSAASATTNTFCAGTTLQLQAATAATGITYQWYLNGVLIPNETNQTISVSSGGNYQVSINQNGCTAVSNIVSINQLPSAIVPSILVEQANAGCAGGEATLTVSGGNYTNLVWNNGQTASTINVSTSGDFSITAIDENGCAVSAGPVSVNFSILDPVPVCIVTVDQVTGKNNVVWEPITSDLINSYVILKETNVANEYAQIGTVAYGSNGLFEDVNSNPQVQANRYKLALIDTCGIQSSASSFHKTIHLTTNLGVGNNVNLIWSNYEGFDFGSYSIYRGTSPNTLNLLSTIASNLNSYTDVNPPAGETYYMIEVEGVSCDPQRTLVYSNSNILDTTVGIEDYTSTTISLYPNPANAVIMLQVNNTLIGQEYVVFDAIGKVIYKNKIQSANEIIQLENFNNGNYFVKVNEEVKRFVVEK